MQRLQSMESFRSHKKTHLLATDLAARGLDIKGVSAVLNYETPQTHDIYLHRVGRTARAGQSGKACTIVTDDDRKLVKKVVKSTRSQSAQTVSRHIDWDAVSKWQTRLEALAGDVDEILLEEKEEKAMSVAERDIKKGENLVKYEDEIKSRPKRTWFESEKEKQQAKEKGKAELNGTLPLLGKKDKKPLSNKQRKRLDATKERKEGRLFKKTKDTRSPKKASKKKSSKRK